MSIEVSRCSIMVPRSYTCTNEQQAHSIQSLATKVSLSSIMQDCECVTATYAVTGVDRKVELGQLRQRRDDVLLVGAVEQQRLDATRADEQAMCCRHDPTHSGIQAFTRQASDLVRVPGNSRERAYFSESEMRSMCDMPRYLSANAGSELA